MVPYNGNTGSNKSFRKAVSLASVIGAKVTVVSCIEERPSFGFFKTKTSRKEFEKEHQSIEKQHDVLAKFAENHNVLFDAKILKNGLASMKILEFAKKHKIDLIIMTKTKISSIYEKRHYQSTIENVLRNAHCPILIQ